MGTAESIRLTFLGGVGEIGMNCLAIETGKGIVILDCGVLFPDNRVAGPDLIIPDLRFFRANRERIAGVIITHGHEDHIGAVPIVFGNMDVPIYAPRFAAALLREKAPEYVQSPAYRLTAVEPGQKVRLAGLEFEFIGITHSIPDAQAILIRTPVGNILHTGDFRIDDSPSLGKPFDRRTFAGLGDEGIHLLLADSTNVEVPGRTQSEQWVADNIEQAAANHPGRVLVSMFSSNVQRIGLLAQVARKLNRRLGLVGRSLGTYTRAALESGYQPLDPNELVDPYFADEMPGQKLFLLVAGSQGEPRSALTRVSSGEHEDVKVREGDLVIYSSKIIPGNEKGIQRVTNSLVRAGAIVLDERNAAVHTSGHARREELKEVLELVRPRHFIPVHGEYRFLHEHGRLARETVASSVTIPDWGHMLTVTRSGVEKSGELDLEHYYVERPLVGSSEELKLRERKKLSFSGLIVVHCRFGQKRRASSFSSDLSLYGVPDPDGTLTDELTEGLRMALVNRAETLSAQTIEEEIRTLVRRVVKRRQDRKPLVHVVLDGVDRRS